MALLQWLRITQLRNLREIHLDLEPRFNIFYGHNGAGKTAVLEALYLLSQCQSFRKVQSPALIQSGTNSLSVAACLKNASGLDLHLGLSKNQAGETRLQAQGLPTRSRIVRAKQVPVQLLSPDSFRLWLEGPVERRAFLDWGVFHVEHSYGEQWQSYQRALKQRNQLLKQGAAFSELLPWEAQLSIFGEGLHALRLQYLACFEPYWQAVWKTFDVSNSLDLKLNLFSGWSDAAKGEAEGSLAQALVNNRMRERRVGYTLVGPHRADLRAELAGNPVAQVLSRGQLKLLICSMLIAQAQVLSHLTKEDSILLCDDLACELDQASRGLVLAALQNLPNQVLLTAIDPEGIREHLLEKQLRMFHVEHGRISRASAAAYGEPCILV